ncbi:hypothetical protein ACQKLP_14415 [Chitinophaga sp. NPDC101104]|uniref:hypothetical protein n=1 Tax=Chitinophaga sp. NPDC101104 TaxID=3390561 RepID=UPI003D064B71
MKNNPATATPQVQPKTPAPFFPAAGASFFAPAAPVAPQAQLLQRVPEDTGAMHEGIAEEYRRSHGLTDEDGLSTAEIVYHLSDPVYVLNHDAWTSRNYSATVQAWQDSRPIWPVLNGPSAKINFLRFILHFDQTNCRPYRTGGASSGGSCEATATALQTFENVCQGFATQMYARYTSAARMDEATTARMSSLAQIDVGTVPQKFHITIFIATVPGHAFNAVQIADNPADIHSYVFFEPQNDQIMTADDPQLRSSIYATAGTFTLSRLTGFNERGQYEQESTHTFIMDATHTFTGLLLRADQRMHVNRLLRDIFMVEDGHAWAFLQNERPGITIDTVVQETIRGMPDDTLAMIFPFLNGRQFRRSSSGAMETIDRTVFLGLMNRPGLEGLIH